MSCLDFSPHLTVGLFDEALRIYRTGNSSEKIVGNEYQKIRTIQIRVLDEFDLVD